MNTTEIQERNTSSRRLFKSFWIAGFESASHVNRFGVRLDMLAGTEHDRQAYNDYQLLRTMGICAARDGIRWHLIDHGGTFDFRSLDPMLRAAKQAGIQVIWDLCHYGWPDGLDFYSAAFIDRFARFSRAVAGLISETTDDVPFFAPMNEISFLSWAIAHGIMAPFEDPSPGEVKRQLVRAAIAGMDAVWSVDKRARFVHEDPVIHVVSPRDRPDLAQAAAQQHGSQYEAWDMIAGSACPELGGAPQYLDIIGISYYHSNQWEYPESRLRWEDTPRDERWLPFHQIIAAVYERYGRPLLVGETSHFGIGRAPWIREIATEVYAARTRGVPVEGVCIYPILDRYDWEDASHWHNSGLWNLKRDDKGNFLRVLNDEYAEELRRAQLLPGMGGCNGRYGPVIGTTSRL